MTHYQRKQRRRQTRGTHKARTTALVGLGVVLALVLPTHNVERGPVTGGAQRPGAPQAARLPAWNNWRPVSIS